MSVAFAVLCILTALLMVVLLEIEVDIKYSAGLTLTLHINILALELKSRKNKKTKKNEAEAQKPSAKVKARRSLAYIKLITALTEDSYITVNAIALPNIVPTDFMGQYIKDASYSAVISIFYAYLASSSLKLTEKAGAYREDSESLLLDVSLKTRVLHALKALIVLRMRLSEIEKEQA